MQDLLLLAAVASILCIGWFLMKKLDCFLESRAETESLELLTGKDSFRIGLSNPLIADSITDMVEHSPQISSGISVCFIQGTEEELRKEFLAHKLDIIFLDGNAKISGGAGCRAGRISLRCTPVVMRHGGLLIRPAAEGNIVQKVLWSEKTEKSFVLRFMDSLKAERTVTEP